MYWPSTSRVRGGHDLLEEYVGTDEDESGAKSGHQTEDIRCRHIESACKHDSDGQRQEGNVGLG